MTVFSKELRQNPCRFLTAMGKFPKKDTWKEHLA